MVLLAIALFTLRNFGRRILTMLTFLPHRILEFYDRFEEGVFGALKMHQLPGLGLLSVAIWMTEALRLYFVVLALGFPGVELGISGAVFVALIGSLLTAVPLSPAGLGIVEAGIVGVLTLVYGVPLPEATAIALLDRVISVFSVIILGSVLYVVSPKPRGHGSDRAAIGPDLGRDRRLTGGACAVRAGRAGSLAAALVRPQYFRTGSRSGHCPPRPGATTPLRTRIGRRAAADGGTNG